MGAWLSFLLTLVEAGDSHRNFSQVSLWSLEPTILESLYFSYKKLKPMQVLKSEFLKMNLLAL